MAIGGTAHAHQTHGHVRSEDISNAGNFILIPQSIAKVYDHTSYNIHNIKYIGYSCINFTNMGFHFSLQNEKFLASPQTENCRIYLFNTDTYYMFFSDDFFKSK